MKGDNQGYFSRSFSFSKTLSLQDKMNNSETSKELFFDILMAQYVSGKFAGL